MKLTQQTNYAIRILMYCARNQSGLSQVANIASAYSISQPFVFKILKPLIHNGFIQSVRGRNGGIRLAMAQQQITIADVVRVTEDNFALAECFDSPDTNCPLVNNCTFNAALNEALDAFFQVLESYTIADLVQSRPNIDFLLGIESTSAIEPVI